MKITLSLVCIASAGVLASAQKPTSTLTGSHVTHYAVPALPSKTPTPDAVALANVSTPAATPASTFRKPILAQYWPAYRSKDQSPREIQWNASDIVNYFVTVTTSAGIAVPANQSVSDIKLFVSEAHKHKVKAILTVGGWTGSIHFSDLVHNNRSRTRFAAKVSAFVNEHGFDGVDLSWTYPNHQGIGCNKIRKNDASNLLRFGAVLRQALGEGKLLTAAVPVLGFVGANGESLADLTAFGKSFDLLNIMTYDISGSWSATTGPLAPLYTCNSDSSVDQAVKLWTSRGVPSDKILISVPSYSTSWTTSGAPKSLKVINDRGTFTSWLFQNHTAVTPQGDKYDNNATAVDVCGVAATGYTGHFTYENMIGEKMLNEDGSKGLGDWVRRWDNCSSTPFLVNHKAQVLVSYDDADSAALKVEYAVKNKLAGVVVFDSNGFTQNVYDKIVKAFEKK